MYRTYSGKLHQEMKYIKKVGVDTQIELHKAI